MSTGRKIFATAQIVNGKIVIDLGDTANYMTVKGSDGIIFIVERNSKEFVEVKDKRYENQNLKVKNMAWYALYKWYKDWSRIGYPNMISWYSEKLNPPKWTILRFQEEIKMAKISKKTIKELEDILDRGCDYADTQTVVTEYANEALKESGCDICQCDDAMIVDWDDKPICTVEEFANIFWDKAVEGILNVLKTQE